MKTQRAGMLALLSLAAVLFAAPAAQGQYQSFFPHGNTPGGDAPYQSVYMSPHAWQPAPPQGHQPGVGYALTDPNNPAMMAAYARAVNAGHGPMMNGGVMNAQHQDPQAAYPDDAVGGYPQQGPYYEGEIQGSESEYGYDEGGYEGESCPAEYGRGRSGHFAGLFANAYCTPHWFDVHAQFMYWTRSETTNDAIPITADGMAGLAPPNIIMTTGDLKFEEQPGFRITGRFNVGPVSDLEASYFGTFFWSATAQTTGNPLTPGNLFHVFSDFGAPPFEDGFPQTDQAVLHRMDYSSELNSVELSWRPQWTSEGMRLHGSWLIGARYIALSEEFRQTTTVDNWFPGDLSGNMDYFTTTTSDLMGLQVGGDSYFCVCNGLLIGGEVKAGIYGANNDQKTTILASGFDTLNEIDRNTTVSFAGEFGVNGVYQISPTWSLQLGYQALYLERVALAADNFNTTTPFVQNINRHVVVRDKGHALYHGFTGGFTYLW